MKKLLRTIPRLAAALAFAATASAAVLVASAQNAGSVPATAFNAAPQRANAAVSIGISIGNYPRWRWDGPHRSWYRSGYAYARPGFVNFGYVGYAPPVAPPYWAQPVAFYHPYYRPAFYGYGYHPYVRHFAYYGRPAYVHRGFRRF